MAQKTSVVYVDDLTGKEITDNDAPTVSFSLDGVDYTIDLSDANQEKMRKALAPYIEVATKVSKTKKKTPPSGTKPAEIRAWAQQNGYDVPERGRIPQEIRDAYEANK